CSHRTPNARDRYSPRGGLVFDEVESAYWSTENECGILAGSAARKLWFVLLICLGSTCTHSTNRKKLVLPIHLGSQPIPDTSLHINIRMSRRPQTRPVAYYPPSRCGFAARPGCTVDAPPRC